MAVPWLDIIIEVGVGRWFHKMSAMPWARDAASFVLWLGAVLVLPLLQYDPRGSYYRSSTAFARVASVLSGVLVLVPFGVMLRNWGLGVWTQGALWWLWLREMLGNEWIFEAVISVLFAVPVVIVVTAWILHGLLSGLAMLGHGIAPHRIISWKITELPWVGRKVTPPRDPSA